jgi:hypothetical protein
VRELGIAWLHLAVLWAFAFAQPLFEVLADSPEFFVARRNTAADIVVIASATVILPPTLLVLAEAAVARWPRVRQGLHLAFVGILAAAFALQVLIDVLGSGAAVLIALAILAGGGLAFAYARFPALRTVLSVLAPAPVFLLVWFLLLSPVADLVLPQSESSAAPRNAAAGNGAPVVMVVFDEFSTAALMDAHGNIDRSRFPNFAALAEQSTWYRNATTVADRTSAAVPALLTGETAEPGQLPTAADHPNSLFTLLGDSYDLDVEEPATDVCPERLCGEEERPPEDERLRSLVSDLSVVSLHLLLPEELADDLPPIDRSFGDFRGRGLDTGDSAASGSQDIPTDAIRNRVGEFKDLISGLDQSRRPTLHFLHVGLPHRPWEYLPDGRRYRSLRGPPPGEHLIEDPASSENMLQQYMLQLTHVDDLLGRLLRRMHQLGLDESAALVVTADHGISLRPGDELRTATPTNIGEIAGVPLFIKAPGQRHGRVDDSPAQTIDIVPTLAKDLELEPAWHPDGHALTDGARPTLATVRLLTIFDKTTSVSFDRFLAARDAAAARIRSTFGPGVEGLFELGSDRALIGSKLGGMPVASATGAQVEWDDPSAFADVDLGASVAPVTVSGRLTGTSADHLRLAIALNGRVSAVTSAYRDRGELVFTTLVSPSALRSGSNSLALFAIRGRSTLVPLRQARQLQYELEERSGGSTVVVGPDRESLVAPAAAEGFVEKVDGGQGRAVVVDGWAVTARKTPVDQVLLFAGDRFVDASRPLGERPDVAAHFGDNNALKSGFRLSGPPTIDPNGDSLRVFAVTGDRATELPQSKNR